MLLRNTQHAAEYQHVMIDTRTQRRHSVNASESPKELAAAFACVVTAPSKNQMDWVARKGGESLFQTLGRIFPEVLNLYDFFFNQAFAKNVHLCWE